MTEQKIAIVGTAEPHWREAPFADESWTIWTCGGIFHIAPRTDRHFELHAKPETCKGWGGTPEQEAAQRNVYWKWLGQQGTTAVLRAPHPDCPEAQVYPKDVVLQAFPDAYFTSSIAWMLALAIMQEPKAIGLWGVDMALTGDPNIPESNEYARQRPSVEFYLGVAQGMGIEVHLPAMTTLLKARKLYGFDDGHDKFLDVMDAKITELSTNLQHAQRVARESSSSVHGLQMALDVAKYAKRNLEY